MTVEKDYKKILKEQIGGLESEVGRQTTEYKTEKGTLGNRVMQYAYEKGLTEKVIKVGVVTGAAYAAGMFIPIVGGILGPAALLGYGGKKFIYDPLFKKKKK